MTDAFEVCVRAILAGGGHQYVSLYEGMSIPKRYAPAKLEGLNNVFSSASKRSTQRPIEFPVLPSLPPYSLISVASAS